MYTWTSSFRLSHYLHDTSSISASNEAFLSENYSDRTLHVLCVFHSVRLSKRTRRLTFPVRDRKLDTYWPSIGKPMLYVYLYQHEKARKSKNTYPVVILKPQQHQESDVISDVISDVAELIETHWYFGTLLQLLQFIQHWLQSYICSTDHTTFSSVSL